MKHILFFLFFFCCSTFCFGVVEPTCNHILSKISFVEKLDTSSNKITVAKLIKAEFKKKDTWVLLFLSLLGAFVLVASLLFVLPSPIQFHHLLIWILIASILMLGASIYQIRKLVIKKQNSDIKKFIQYIITALVGLFIYKKFV